MTFRTARAVLVIGVCLAAVVSAGARAPGTRTVNVSVLDKRGAPVVGLTASDFTVTDNGAPREIAGVQTASTNFRLAIIDSDGGSGGYQTAIGTFLQKLLKEADQRAEISLVSVVEQPEVVLDYAVEPSQIVSGINQLGQRAGGRPRPGQLMDAITATLRTIARPGYRPVIVVLRIGREAPSADRAQNVREAMARTGTALFVVSPPGAGSVGGGGGGAGGGGGNMGAASGQFGDATMADASMQLQLVLEDGSRESGGRSITANGNGAIKAMELLAQELLNTYAITFAVPPDAPPSDTVQIGVARKDVKIGSQSRAN